MRFSATMPAALVALARTHMRHPVNIRAESPSETQMVPATAHFVYRAHSMDKIEVVARILQAENRGLSIVFTRTKREAQRVADDLAERGFAAAALHGDMQQVSRERAMRKFRDGAVDVLVATDVAARGLDVEGVTHVINYTCPEDDKNYLHRIGRTGRAGASGVAVTFVDWADLTRWKMINQALDLPFEEPEETYSTSEHLFHDLGIPRSAKGRLASAGPVQPAAPGETPVKKTDEPTGGGERSRSRSRTRTRSRSGQPVAGPPPGAAEGSPESGSSEPAEAPRRRRRRR